MPAWRKADADLYLLCLGCSHELELKFGELRHYNGDDKRMCDLASHICDHPSQIDSVVVVGRFNLLKFKELQQRIAATKDLRSRYDVVRDFNTAQSESVKILA